MLIHYILFVIQEILLELIKKFLLPEKYNRNHYETHLTAGRQGRSRGNS